MEPGEATTRGSVVGTFNAVYTYVTSRLDAKDAADAASAVSAAGETDVVDECGR
jgi:hypothetical protein